MGIGFFKKIFGNRLLGFLRKKTNFRFWDNVSVWIPDRILIPELGKWRGIRGKLWEIGKFLGRFLGIGATGFLNPQS